MSFPLDKNSIRIKTERVFLRVLKQDDANERYLSWFNDSATKEYIEYSKQNALVSDLRKYIAEKQNSDTTLFFGIFSNDTNKHIGNIKFEPINFEKKSAVLGILIGEKSFRGAGISKEVIECLSKWFKENLKITSFTLGVNNDNQAALKAYKSIGFKITKENSKGLFMRFDF